MGAEFKHLPLFTVGLVELGDVSHHLDLKALLRKLRRATDVYNFKVLQPIRELPEPTEEPAQGRGFSPQFNANVLFSILETHSRRREVNFIVGVIDSEIYDELFSTISSENDAVLISLRTRTLQLILRNSGRNIANYVGLELAAQLLCIQYRRAASLTSDPKRSDPPWHIQRLNCLFDWYGISPTNVTKLLQPTLSPFARQYFVNAAVPDAVVEDGVGMAKRMTKLDLRSVFHQLAPDPFLAVVMGALIGWATSYLSAGKQFISQIAFALVVGAVVVWRAYVILTDKNRI